MLMGDSGTNNLLDSNPDPLSHCLDAESARLVTELRIDPTALAERANDGLLTGAERGEY
jgi:hypothetical protein